MAETYCGKSCAYCTYRESLECPGCKAGPGKLYAGGCELAKCCTGKGHETCDSCSFHTTCGTLHRCEAIPEYRAEQAEKLTRKSLFLGKWLWLLFWLIVPSVVAEILTNQAVVRWLPDLYLPGLILSILSTVAYGLILLKMSSQEAHYHTAGICTLLCAACSTVIACISGMEERTGTLLMSLAVIVADMVGTYHQFMGHREVLHDVDPAQSEKWRNLWMWYLGMIGAIAASLLIMCILPFLGAVVLFAASIGIIVVGILQLVYLYRTARLFRQVAAQ